jgi:hypothetical protein
VIGLPGEEASTPEKENKMSVGLQGQFRVQQVVAHSKGPWLWMTTWFYVCLLDLLRTDKSLHRSYMLLILPTAVQKLKVNDKCIFIADLDF